MLKPIKTKKDYEEALGRIYSLMQRNLKLHSKQMNEMEILSILVEKYEEEHYPIPPPDPIEAIKFTMEQKGFTKSDLVKCLGYKSRVSDILSRRRKLTIDMIKCLHKEWKIPVETLIGS